MIAKIVNASALKDESELDYRHRLMEEHERYVNDFKDVVRNWSDKTGVTHVPYDTTIFIIFLKPVIAYETLLIHEFGVGRNMQLAIDAILDSCFDNHQAIYDVMYNDVITNIGQLHLTSLQYACRFLTTLHLSFDEL